MRGRYDSPRAGRRCSQRPQPATPIDLRHRMERSKLAAKWGAVADCVYRSNSSGLCDIDNRALAVQAANIFLVQADQIASKPENYSANQSEVESLTQVKSRVLDSMQDLVRNGVLIVSDFTQFAPASVRKTLSKSDPEKNACAR